MDFELPTRPSMRDSEIACLKSHLAGSRKYLEFGCGGSTILAAELGIPELYSVESDKAWADMIRDSAPIKPLADAGRYRVRWIDIGEVGAWGAPADARSAVKWPAYSTAIWREIVGVPDFVLVDGRFRVSSALQTIARCADLTTIAVHDFERKEYWRILDYTHVVEQVDNLVILRKRNNFDTVRFALDCADYLLAMA